MQGEPGSLRDIKGVIKRDRYQADILHDHTWSVSKSYLGDVRGTQTQVNISGLTQKIHLSPTLLQALRIHYQIHACFLYDYLLVRGLLQCVTKTDYTCKLGVGIIKGKMGHLFIYVYMYVCMYVCIYFNHHAKTRWNSKLLSNCLAHASLGVFQRQGT